MPVVVLTGHGQHELALRAAVLGAWDFITRPIDPDPLNFVVARALHDGSEQRSGPFVAVHCGALSAELLESELFGHLKGSFTGAYRAQSGWVEAAHGGSLFLDEVGEMPAPMQVKLFRFLQEGSFREDLFYRLRGVVLRTPALAERVADVPVLATRFLQRFSARLAFSAGAIAWLSARQGAGNVRELKAVLETAAAPNPAQPPALHLELLQLAAGEQPNESPPPSEGRESAGLLDAALGELERRLIKDAMAAAGGNQSEAARQLGVSRVGLIKKLGRLGVR